MMNGVHDMGGAHGFGPIRREENEPVFHADWEARVYAINRLSRAHGYFNIDEMRFGIERMQPAHYLRSTYYERWLATIEYNLIEKGLLTSDELDSKTGLFQSQVEIDPAQHPSNERSPQTVRDIPETPAISSQPRFAVGDRVLARNVHPTGHTRAPRYIRGKRGVIHLVHRPAIFPDTHAHGLGENTQCVYNVRFDGRELWGESAEPGQTLSIDLWEIYLEPDPS